MTPKWGRGNPARKVRHTMAITELAIQARRNFIMDTIRDNPNVVAGYDEFEDGIWLELKAGLLASNTGTHVVHEWTIGDCKRSLKSLEACLGSEPCECPTTGDIL